MPRPAHQPKLAVAPATARSPRRKPKMLLPDIVAETQQCFDDLCDDMAFPIHLLDQATDEASREVWYKVREAALALFNGSINRDQFAEIVLSHHLKTLTAYHNEIKNLEKEYSKPQTMKKHS